MRPRRRITSWLEDVPRRHSLLAPARAAFPSLTYKRRQSSGGVTYVFQVNVPVPNYDERHVRIEFLGAIPTYPRVWADGPTESPHRYRHDHVRRLCLWYPDDGADRRWHPDDGLLALLGMIEAHLFKEAYWRETDEWLGEEAPHGEPIVDVESTGRRRAA